MPSSPNYREDAKRLALKGPRYSVRVFGDDGEQHLGRLVGAVRALLPISHGTEREVETRRKLFLRQVQLLAQRAHSRHATSAGKLRFRCRQSIWIRNGGTMTRLFAHRVEGAPIALWRLLRVELKSRDTSSFHAVPLLWRI